MKIYDYLLYNDQILTNTACDQHSNLNLRCRVSAVFKDSRSEVSFMDGRWGISVPFIFISRHTAWHGRDLLPLSAVNATDIFILRSSGSSQEGSPGCSSIKTQFLTFISWVGNSRSNGVWIVNAWWGIFHARKLETRCWQVDFYCLHNSVAASRIWKP